MEECWEQDPQTRPTMLDVFTAVKDEKVLAARANKRMFQVQSDENHWRNLLHKTLSSLTHLDLSGRIRRERVPYKYSGTRQIFIGCYTEEANAANGKSGTVLFVDQPSYFRAVNTNFHEVSLLYLYVMMTTDLG